MDLIKKIFAVPEQGTLASVALLLLRLCVGCAFVTFGWVKIQAPMSWMGPEGMPGILQALAAISEFGGGIAMILGVLVPLAMCGISCTMLVATFVMITAMNAPFLSMGKEPAYFFAFPLTYLCVALVLMTVGPGKFSVDRLLFGAR